MSVGGRRGAARQRSCQERLASERAAYFLYSVAAVSLLNGRICAVSQQFAAWRADFISRNLAMSLVNTSWSSNAQRAGMNGRPSRKRSVDCVAGMLGSKMLRGECGVPSAGRSNVQPERCGRRSRGGRGVWGTIRCRRAARQRVAQMGLAGAAQGYRRQCSSYWRSLISCNRPRR